MKKQNKEKKRFNWGQLIMLLIGAGIGGACGMLTVRQADYLQKEDGLWAFLLMLAVLYVGLLVAMLVQIILHEAGHLVFGLLSGYGFSSFRIGSLMLLKENGKLRLCRHSLAGTGGQCLMTPPDMVDGKIPYVLYNLGGCIFNLAAGLILLGVYFLLPPGGIAGMLALIGTIVGIGFALLNGIPLDNGLTPNDGHNALSLGKDPRALRAFWVQMKVVEQIARGVRLKDMPEEWFDMPRRENVKNSMVAAVEVFACNRLLDMGKLAEADKRMEQLLASDVGVVGLHRRLLTCDRIFCLLVAGKNVQAMALHTTDQRKFMKTMRTSLGVIRTEYALAKLARRDEAQARTWLGRFEKQAKHHPYACDVESERELLEMV